MRTQVSTLNAVTNTGGIFIDNGVAAPTTLTVSGSSNGVHVTGASGDIVLINNGSIEKANNLDFIEGPGNVTVKALGGSADIGDTNGILVGQNNTRLIDLEAGRDLDIQAVRGGAITLVAGRNFNLTGDVTVGFTSGGIAATAGGNITMAAPNNNFSEL